MSLAENLNKLYSLLISQGVWLNVGTTALRIVIITILAILVVNMGKVVIRRFFKLKMNGLIRKSERRELTLLKLLENSLTYIVYFSAILSVLTEFDIDVKGILAGAGVLGLAVGFGAQSLVKDVITGFFILFEDQFSVGDYVKIGTAEGYVEEIGLRTTKIKSFTGEIFIMPNGSIAQVINYSMENSLAIVDVSIPFEVDLHRAENLIEQYLKLVVKEDPDFINTPKLMGAYDFTETEMVVRIIAETKPMRHYDSARVIGMGLKKYMEKEGIQIPYPILVTKSLTNVG